VFSAQRKRKRIVPPGHQWIFGVGARTGRICVVQCADNRDQIIFGESGERKRAKDTRKRCEDERAVEDHHHQKRRGVLGGAAEEQQQQGISMICGSRGIPQGET